MVEKIRKTPEVSTRDKVLQAIYDSLPKKFFQIDEQDIYSPKTLYNLISAGKGPEIVDIRGKKFLERDSFVFWLNNKANKRGRRKNG